MGWPLATVNLTPASEVDLALSSVVSFLLPVCLCLMEAPSLVPPHPAAYLVLGVVPQI